MGREPRLTLAVAESVTCGQVQARVGAISGASEFFLGGITAYTLDQKVRHLGVDRAAAAAVDCVSEEVARQMARGACELFGSDFGVATTGYAEPASGTPEPFAWWAVTRRASGQWTDRTGRLDCSGLSRTAVQQVIAETVMKELVDAVRAFRG